MEQKHQVDGQDRKGNQQQAGHDEAMMGMSWGRFTAMIGASTFIMFF